MLLNLPTRSTIRAMIAAVVCVLLASCANWVEVNPQARGVAVLDKAQTSDCHYLGTTDAAVLIEAGFLPRNSQAINADLVNLARNDAADLGGNAVAALNEQQDGHQTFGIYQCDSIDDKNKDAQPQAPSGNTGIQSIPYTPPR